MSKKWLEIRNQAEITEIFINGDIENDAYNDGIMEWFGLKDTNVYPLEVKKLWLRQIIKKFMFISTAMVEKFLQE